MILKPDMVTHFGELDGEPLLEKMIDSPNQDISTQAMEFYRMIMKPDADEILLRDTQQKSGGRCHEDKYFDDTVYCQEKEEEERLGYDPDESDELFII